MRIAFHGAAGEVTGSMHLVETGGKRVLLDCGLFQGRREDSRRKNENWPVEADEVDAVVLSHAHIDHAGRLPLLVKRGYRGPIYCTGATRDLSSIMLPDSGHIQESDAHFLRKRGLEIEPLYTASDGEAVAGQMVTVDYEVETELVPGISLTFHEAGHILGSASVVLTIDGPGRERRIVFSGDVGRRGLPIIRDPSPPRLPESADALIVESTYAGRVHESVDQSSELLARHVTTIARRGGKMFVPAFAVGRTQEVLYELHRLARDGRIPEVPIYVDSPLAVKATDIFRHHPGDFDRKESLVRQRSDIFAVPGVNYVRSVEESKRLNSMRGPAVIIAASGMAESGRILHHLRNGLGDHRNMVLIVGWQGSNTLGNRLREGAKQVRIFGEELPVRADVNVVAGYSAHGDRDDLAAWISGLGPVPKRAFCVHGEAGLAPMAELVRTAGVPDVNVPGLHDSVDLQAGSA
jgi:metallo-beta-lactamase family protein